MALATFREAKRRLADSHGGLIPYEGPDDCGLFRGIFFRYCRELYAEKKNEPEIREMIHFHAETVASRGMNREGLIGGSWDKPETGTVDLAQHLSGIMVMEMAARC